MAASMANLGFPPTLALFRLFTAAGGSPRAARRLGKPPTLALNCKNTVSRTGRHAGSRPQRCPGPGDQCVVLGPGRRQVEQARREVAVAPRGGELVVVLQHRG